MNINQYKFTGNDESYTYPSFIKPLIKYIEEYKQANNIVDITIWCPFDMDESYLYDDILLYKSNYIIVLEEAGYKVISSHIAKGQDFFKYEPESYDLIISNPPFKNKKFFFERVIKLDKPFALVTTAGWLNDGGVI